MRLLLAAALAAAIVPVAFATPVRSASPAAATVHIKDEMFIPATVTVKAGQSVTFVNDDDDAHTATADDMTWDSEGLNLGQKWVHVFSKPGKIPYHCTVHPMMHGTIIVRSAS